MDDDLDKRIAEMEVEHPDNYKEPEDKVIYLFYKAYYTDDCNFQDVIDCDCTHPRGWHRIPYRVVKNWVLYRFETIRRRPDGEPGTDWTPMTPEEREDVLMEWVSERMAQLVQYPYIEEGEDA